MIPDFEIPKCPEFEVKSKIGKIFKKHNPLEEYSVRIYKIDPYFYERCEKKQKLVIIKEKGIREKLEKQLMKETEIKVESRKQ